MTNADRFHQNITRVQSLLDIYKSLRQTAGRPKVTEADTLRAAVVFLHSAFEDYFRAILTERIISQGEQADLKNISILGGEHHRAEKFTLSELLPYTEMNIGAFIAESVKKHMSEVSFNDYQDIANWSKRGQIDLGNFCKQESISLMIRRRHKIVHEADRNDQNGSGNHGVTAINAQTVSSWMETTTELVLLIDAQLP